MERPGQGIVFFYVLTPKKVTIRVPSVGEFGFEFDLGKTRDRSRFQGPSESFLLRLVNIIPATFAGPRFDSSPFGPGAEGGKGACEVMAWPDTAIYEVPLPENQKRSGFRRPTSKMAPREGKGSWSPRRVPPVAERRPGIRPRRWFRTADPLRHSPSREVIELDFGAWSILVLIGAREVVSAGGKQPMFPDRNPGPPGDGCGSSWPIVSSAMPCPSALASRPAPGRGAPNRGRGPERDSGPATPGLIQAVVAGQAAVGRPRCRPPSTVSARHRAVRRERRPGKLTGRPGPPTAPRDSPGGQSPWRTGGAGAGRRPLPMQAVGPEHRAGGRPVGDGGPPPSAFDMKLKDRAAGATDPPRPDQTSPPPCGSPNGRHGRLIVARGPQAGASGGPEGRAHGGAKVSGSLRSCWA